MGDFSCGLNLETFGGWGVLLAICGAILKGANSLVLNLIGFILFSFSVEADGLCLTGFCPNFIAESS